MPSTTPNQKVNYELQQLIPPKPQPMRGKPFPLSGNEEWFIYPHGKSVYMYNKLDHKLTREYCEHAYQVKVAKLSPSGRFVASGDANGNLRIWSFESFKLELEMRILGGGVYDLSWSNDEKFISACGEGRDQFANVIKVDGGANFGELVGPSKPCSSIAINGEICVVGSDDKSVTIYRASPTFKFVKSVKNHENFVQSVRISPNGQKFASAGADGKVFIYSCENFEMLQEIKAHEGGILWMEFLKDDDESGNDNEILLTASSDKSIKLWKTSLKEEVNFKQVYQSKVDAGWNYEKQICGFMIDDKPGQVIILRLNGSIEVLSMKDGFTDGNFDLFNGIGHAKGVVDVKVTSSGFCSLSYDGEVKNWTEKSSFISGCDNFFNSNVQRLIDQDSAVFENKIFHKSPVKIEEFSSKIVGFDDGGKILLEDGTIRGGRLEDFSGGIMACALKGDNIAIYGGDEKIKLSFYRNEKKMISFDDLTSKITCMAFDEESGKLAVADEQRRIKIYRNNNNNNKENNKWERVGGLQWSNHAARIDSLCWLEGKNCDLLASAGVDGNLMFWSPERNKIGPVCVIKNAHLSPINRIIRFGNADVITAGSDSCIKIWGLNEDL